MILYFSEALFPYSIAARLASLDALVSLVLCDLDEAAPALAAESRSVVLFLS